MNLRGAHLTARPRGRAARAEHLTVSIAHGSLTHRPFLWLLRRATVSPESHENDSIRPLSSRTMWALCVASWDLWTFYLYRTRHYEGPRCPMRPVFRPMLGDERWERLCKRMHVLHEAELIVDELQAPFGLLQPLHAILGQFARPYGVCGQQRRVELG